MASKREQIMDAIMATLAAGGGVTGVSAANTYRSRVASVMREEGRVLNVRALRDDAAQIVSDIVERRLLIECLLWQRGAIPDDVVDESIVSVYAKLMANLQLGGLALDIEPGAIIFQMEDADQPALVVTMQFVVYYRHQLTTLDA